MGLPYRLCAATLLLVGFFATPAAALPVQLVFSGEITDVYDETGLVGGSVVVGTPFTGTLVYDPDSLPSDTSSLPDGTQEIYTAAAPPASFALSIGPWTLAAGPLLSGNGFLITVVDRDGTTPDPDLVHWNTDVTSVAGFTAPALVGNAFFQFVGALAAGASELSSTSLSAVPLSLAAWDEAGLSVDLILDGTGEGISITGSISDLSVSSVPEPALGLLLGLVGAGAVAQRLRASPSA